METEKVEFTPRPYQTQIAELAKTKNTIIFLPTGSGKTYIAVLVMKHFLSLERRPFSQGGKRCFFIVNTVVLVDQQASVLERHLPIKRAGRYFGAMNVDSWSRETWTAEYEEHETLVMTAEIFRMTLEHGFISPSQIAVIIFDECHRAVGDSPMHEAAKLICGSKGTKPRMIGLSATLLNANAKTLQDAQNHVAELLRTFDAVLGSIGGEGVLCFSTNPREQIISYDAAVDAAVVATPDVAAALAMVRQAQRNSSIFVVPRDNSRTDKLKKVRKEVKNQLFEVEYQLESLGIYGASKAALLAIKIFEFMKVSEMDFSILLKLTEAVNAVTAMYGVLTRHMAHDPEISRAYKFSSRKVLALVALLCQVQMKCKEDDFRCLVFVQRKMTARLVCTVLKHIAKIPEYSFIKPVFVVGTSGSPDPFPSGAEDTERTNRKALQLFESGESNVLVSTEVTEEGIDIPLCNCVVKFDKVLSYRSYMQSKGRARSKESNYYILETRDDVKSTVLRVAEYTRIQDHLTSIVTETETDADDLSQGIPVVEEPEIYETARATLHDVGAMSILCKYISMFYYDQYSGESPEWKVIKVPANGLLTGPKDSIYANVQNFQFIAELTLPHTVPHRLTVQGHVKANMKLAKRNAAFKMCIELHKLGELDDNLVPVAPGSHFTPDPNWWPHSNITAELETKIEGGRLGTRDNGQLYFSRVPKCLTDCAPNDQQKAYLHLFKIKPQSASPPPDRQYAFIYDLVQREGSFGLLTTTQMPKVCPFSVYYKIGELAVDFIPNHSTVSLTDEELTQLEFFGRIFFLHMVPCVVETESDIGHGGKDYLVVPTKTDQSCASIDWTTVKDSLSLLDTNIPSIESRLALEVPDRTYLGAVILPWYKGNDNTIYVVTEIKEDMNAMSMFPEDYCSFSERYLRDYQVQVLRPHLPLLEAKPLNKSYNGLRKGTVTLVSRSKHLYIPDLVKLIPFSSTLWIKAIIMPTILLRLERLLIAEELRSVIAMETCLGHVNPPQDFVWQRLVEESEETVNVMRVSGLEIKPVERPIAKPMLKSAFKEENVVLKDFMAEFWDDDGAAQDTNFLKSCIEVLKYQSVNLPNIDQTFDEVPNVSVPFPRLLRSVGSPDGLQLNKVLAALTAPSANDLVNYERLETLGDSFLKVVTSLFVYEACSLKSEGLLTSLKGRIIGNRNLFNCALNKKLPEYMTTTNVSLPKGWFPPKFVPTDEKMVQRKSNSQTKDDVDDVIVKFSLDEKPRFMCVKNLGTWEKTHYNGTHLISDKAVADCVEALLGATLLDCGWNGGIDLLLWFQILPETVKRIDGTVEPLKKLLQTGYQEPVAPSKKEVAFKEVDQIQSLLGYTFKETKFLRQALTHPSYDAQNSYERLEFIGDAVLDFLITSYIYENCGLLTPGKLTDLRSALVNNITFAALAAKYGLNRFMQMNSPVLLQAVETFIGFQKRSNHKVDSDVLILCDDEEVKISDLITVPKSLADLFEALAGAIFFDSDRDLKTVWRVFYPMMHPVIEAFCKDIPIDPVRKLYETYTDCKLYFEYNRDEVNNRMIATCTVQSASFSRTFHGFGENRKSAKKAVAKLALYSLKNKSEKTHTRC